MEDFSDRSEEEEFKKRLAGEDSDDDVSSSDSEGTKDRKEEERIKAHRHAMARRMAKLEEKKDDMNSTARSSKGFLKLKSKAAQEQVDEMMRSSMTSFKAVNIEKGLNSND